MAQTRKREVVHVTYELLRIALGIPEDAILLGVRSETVDVMSREILVFLEYEQLLSGQALGADLFMNIDQLLETADNG